MIGQSPVKGKYDTAIDSESAYEILKKRVETTAASHPADEAQSGGWIGNIGSVLGTIFGTTRKRGRATMPWSSESDRCARRSSSNRQVRGASAGPYF